MKGEIIMKKKLFALGMVVSLIFGCFSGCGKEEKATSVKEEISVNTENENNEEVSETLQNLREKGTITIAGSGTAPFGFRDTETDEIKGIDLEISMAIAKKLGIENVNYVITSFDNLISELQAGNCDVISSAMYITEERQKVISFSNVYYQEGEGILYPEENGYKSLEDMKGAICAIEQGSGYINVAEKYVEDGIFERIDMYSSIDEVVLAVNSGKADVAMADNVALAYIGSQEANKDAKLVLLDPYEMQYAGNIGAGFSKNDSVFIEEWNTALDELKEDGTVMEIMKKYGLTDAFYVDQGEDKTINPE